MSEETASAGQTIPLSGRLYIENVKTIQMDVKENNELEANLFLRKSVTLFNILVLIGCLLITVILSLQILYPQQYARNPLLLNIQFWICITFLTDFFLRFFLYRNKAHYLLSNILFFIISIPYLNIIEYYRISISDSLYYFLHIILLLRGGYGLVVVVSWITSSKLTNLFVSYLIILVAITYFSSLLFFSIESKVNSSVSSYWDALWWASMDVTTVGSDVNPVTPTGRILSVMLAVLGMCMFPIFTAFITAKYQSFKSLSPKISNKNID